MIALNLTEIKDFMNKLLCTEIFDNFLLKEGTLQNSVVWHLDGALTPDFYSTEELEELGLSGFSFLPFRELRPQFFHLMRGKRTPSYFKFIFLLSPDNLARTLAQTKAGFTPEDIAGMFLNLKYQNGALLLTTGISYRIFSIDKSLENEWDMLIRRFLKNHEIAFEEL
ncbi:MAG: DUF5721 family protein [Clostridiales bacterium]|nr:DUF5721 family protein [Clostridiales bacterium]